MKARKLFLSVFALSAAVVTFTASTYAWFRIGSTAYVNNLEFKVISGLGFKVSIDGTNSAFFTETLESKQIAAAILHKYNPDKYVIYKNKLFLKTEVTVDGVEKYNYRLLELDEMSKIILDEIKLDLATTMKVEGDSIKGDCWTLYNEYGEEIEDKSKYLEFDIYFKTESDLSSSDKHFGVYLSDDATYNPYGSNRTDSEGRPYSEPMPFKTKLESTPQQVKLLNSLSYLDSNYTVQKLEAKDKINVNIANAIRIAKKDNGQITVSPKNSRAGELEFDLDNNNSVNLDKDYVLPTTDDREIMEAGTDTSAKIYEIAGEDNLGSYATDYSGDDDELNRLYNSNYSAMWTYYESLGAKTDDVNPLSYDKLAAILDDGSGNGDIITKLTENQKITRLDSGLRAHKVTFRFWLEGYDADYFAGVSGLKTIKCNLAFKSDSKDNN